MIKRRSPKEIVESGTNPKLEDSWAKLSLKKPANVSSRREERSVRLDYDEINRLLESSKRDRYTLVHTHPVQDGFLDRLFYSHYRQASSKLFPSANDLRNFLGSQKEKASVIVARGTESGKVYGSFIMRKTKRTPTNLKVDDFNGILNAYQRQIPRSDESDRKALLRDIEDKYHLQYRWIYPSKSKKLSNIFLGAVLIGMLVFLSPNLTGNVIGNLSQSLSDWIGGVLFIIGLICAFFYLKRR